jgi:acyl carrier protein
MTLLNDVKMILGSVLQLADNGSSLTEESALLGAMPEFDSMAVVSVITAMEEQFGFVVEDDEIDAEVFETVGSLLTFVEQKVE